MTTYICNNGKNVVCVCVGGGGGGVNKWVKKKRLICLMLLTLLLYLMYAWLFQHTYILPLGNTQVGYRNLLNSQSVIPKCQLLIMKLKYYHFFQ